MAFMFEFFVTNVEKEGQFLQVWGHKDKNAAQNVERTIQQSFNEFERGVGVPDPRTLLPELLVCARFDDGAYYRARITHVDWSNGQCLCYFIDYGNGARVPMSDIRTLDPSNVLLKIPPQATCFLLSGVVGTWDPPVLNCIRNFILYTELKALSVQSIGQINTLKLYAEGDQDLGAMIVKMGMATPVTPESFEVMVWRSTVPSLPTPMPGLAAANSYPSSVWPMLQRPSFPNIIPVPAVIPLQRPAVPHPQPAALDMRTARFPSYPLLEINSEHKVFVSHCDKATSTIYVQLSNDLPELDKLQAAINSAESQLDNLSPPFIPGRICIAKSSEYDQLFRAVITRVTDKVEVYFVDYGNSDTIQPSEVFEILPDYTHLQV